jgi:hypothetical protein
MDDTNATNDLERRLAELGTSRAQAAGAPSSLKAGVARRIRRRQRLTVAAACLVVVVALAAGALVAHGDGGGTQVAVGPVLSCYPQGIPAALADDIRSQMATGTPVSGAEPHARVVAVPDTGAPTATVPDHIDGGYVVELSGMHFPIPRTPPGYVDPAPHTPNFKVVMYDQALFPEDLSIADRPADLDSVGTPVAVSLDRSCGSSTPTTTANTTPTTAGTPPSTVLNGPGNLTVPFTADDGALTVTAGPPPDGITPTQVQAILEMLGSPPPSGGFNYPVLPAAWPGSVVSGRVSLKAGLGVPAIDARPAWIVPITYAGLICPYNPDEANHPPWASHLAMIIIEGTGNDQIIEYTGIGGGGCGSGDQVTAHTWTQLTQR